MDVSWHKRFMTVVNKARRPEVAPALFRLLCDSSLSRTALDCCGAPVAILDAPPTKAVVRYANATFEKFFGYAPGEALGKGLATLVFRGDEALVRRLVEEQRRWELAAWGKDGLERPVGVTVACLRDLDGTLTHWMFTFSDLSELERLRAEVLSLRTAAGPGLRSNADASREVLTEPAHEERLPQMLFGQR